MSNVIKGKGQRLIPEELLKYLQAVKNTYPEALEIVTANPTLSGDESALESIGINGVKYSVSGGGATLGDIVDSQGNHRFVEDDGTYATITNFTPNYCKWSLSGTHLMCVVAGSVKSTTVFYANNDIVTFELPAYIGDKIFPVWDNHLAYKELELVRSSGDIVTLKTYINYENNKITIKTWLTQQDIQYDCNFRWQIDLLIDADYE